MHRGCTNAQTGGANRSCTADPRRPPHAAAQRQHHKTRTSDWQFWFGGQISPDHSLARFIKRQPIPQPWQPSRLLPIIPAAFLFLAMTRRAPAACRGTTSWEPTACLKKCSATTLQLTCGENQRNPPGPIACRVIAWPPLMIDGAPSECYGSSPAQKLIQTIR